MEARGTEQSVNRVNLIKKWHQQRYCPEEQKRYARRILHLLEVRKNLVLVL